MESSPRSHRVSSRCWVFSLAQTKIDPQEGLHGLEQEELDDAWLWVGWIY